MLRGVLKIENATFQLLNVKDLELGSSYDVILNLGLMYHLSTPFELLRNCRKCVNKGCVIDTICHREPFSGYHVVTNKNVDSCIEGDLMCELQATNRGIVDTIVAAGFKEVIEFVGVCDEDIDLYCNMSRRCFVAFKDSAESCLRNVLSPESFV